MNDTTPTRTPKEPWEAGMHGESQGIATMARGTRDAAYGKATVAVAFLFAKAVNALADMYRAIQGSSANN